MPRPDLSVIIVSFNVADRLLACLRSVRAAAGDLCLEIIVVDNASEDDSVLQAGQLAWVRLIANPDNRGFAAACNQGLRVARGRHVLLLNPDTIVRADVLPAAVRYLGAHPDVGVLGCRVLESDGRVAPTSHAFPSILNLALVTSGLARFSGVPWLDRYQLTRWDRSDARDVDVVTGCFMMLRREVVDHVGLLDEDFFFCGEEVDWCLRIRLAGYRARFAPVGEIVHEGNASGRQLGARRALLLSLGLVRLHRKHGGLASALAVWLMLGAHNASRALLYGLTAVLTPRRTAPQARHFAAVASRFGEAWPRSTSRAPAPGR